MSAKQFKQPPAGARAMAQEQQWPHRDTPEALWPVVLAELRQQLARATFNNWLLDSQVLPPACTAHFWVVVVGNEYACEWLAGRLSPMVARTLAHLAGRDITVCFIPRRLMRPDGAGDLTARPVTRLPIPPQPGAGEPPAGCFWLPGAGRKQFPAPDPCLSRLDSDIIPPNRLPGDEP